MAKFWQGSWSKDRIKRAILVLGILAVLLNFLTSLGDCLKYGGVDLRDKVTGARALLDGLDPYMTTWDPSLYDKYLNPAERYPGPSRNTVTPTVLVMYSLFANMPYKTQRLLWFGMEWLAAIASVLILQSTLQNSRYKFLFLCLALFFFLSSHFWRLHVERGQYYVFLLLLFSLSLYFAQKRGGGKAWLGGIPLGIAAALRPSYLLMGLVLWIFGWRKTTLVFLIAFFFTFTLSLLLGGIQPWEKYTRNVLMIENSIIDPDYVGSHFGAAILVPNIAEGVELTKMMGSATSVTFIRILNGVSKLTLWFGKQNISFFNKILLGIYLVLAIGFFWFMRNGYLASRFALLNAVLFVMTTDYFVPLRWGYVDILFLFPLAASLQIIMHPRCPWWILALVLGGMIFGHSILSSFADSKATILRSLLFMGGMNLTVLGTLWVRKKQSHFHVPFHQCPARE